MGMMNVPGDAADLPRPAVRLLGRGRGHRRHAGVRRAGRACIIGIGLSLLWLVSVATQPPMPCWGASPAPRSSATSSRTPTTSRSRGVVILRLDGGLFFATSDALEDRVRELVQRPARRQRASCSTAKGINFVDSQGSAKLDEILELTEQAGVTLRLARVKPAVRATLERDGVIERLGRRPVHGNVHRAVAAQLGAGRRAGRGQRAWAARTSPPSRPAEPSPARRIDRTCARQRSRRRRRAGARGSAQG